MKRRAFQHLGLLLFPVVFGSGMLAGAIRFLSPLPRGRKLTRLEVGNVEEFESAGPPRRVEFNLTKFDRRVVFVFREEDGFRAFDAQCTHLACNVTWNRRDDNAFACPCHDAGFNREGAAIRVPAKKPLTEYAVADPAETDGKVVVLLDQIKKTS